MLKTFPGKEVLRASEQVLWNPIGNSSVESINKPDLDGGSPCRRQ